MNTRTATPIAARILALRPNDAARNSRVLPEIAAVHFWDPSCVAGAVIIGADGAYLCADASVPWEQHLDAYAAGHRTSVTQ